MPRDIPVKKQKGIPDLRPMTDSEWRRARGPAAYRAGIEMGREQVEQRLRTACTVCGDPQDWYRLEPGTGRCTRCQP